jgi:hypothetical protein
VRSDAVVGAVCGDTGGSRRVFRPGRGRPVGTSDGWGRRRGAGGRRRWRDVATGRAGIGRLEPSPPKVVLGGRGASAPRRSGAAAGEPAAVPTCTVRFPPSGGAARARSNRAWWSTGFGSTIAFASDGWVRVDVVPRAEMRRRRPTVCRRVACERWRHREHIHLDRDCRFSVRFAWTQRSRVAAGVARSQRPLVSRGSPRGVGGRRVRNLRHVEGAIAGGNTSDARSVELNRSF